MNPIFGCVENERGLSFYSLVQATGYLGDEVTILVTRVCCGILLHDTYRVSKNSSI